MDPELPENRFTPQKCLRGGRDLYHTINPKSIWNNRVNLSPQQLCIDKWFTDCFSCSRASQTEPTVFFYAFVDINNPVKALEHKRGITHSGIWTFRLTSLLHRHGERLTELPTKIMEIYKGYHRLYKWSSPPKWALRAKQLVMIMLIMGQWDKGMMEPAVNFLSECFGNASPSFAVFLVYWVQAILL